VTLRVVDLSSPYGAEGEIDPDILVGVGDPSEPGAEYWLERTTFTLTDRDCDDRRTICVPSVPAALAELSDRVQHWPQAAAVCDDVLRAVDVEGPAFAGVITESLAYSTLQSGQEFGRWLAERGPVTLSDIPNPVVAQRDDDTLYISFNRPQRHNAFSNDARAELLDMLSIAQLDTSVSEVVLAGNGPSFCSGGDLGEFGTFADPASAHLARTRHSPALALDELTRRLGRACRAQVHGQVLGSGLEMAAFCGHVVCAPDATLALPELALGLIPGAGGTVSITRRIGRWRTAYLVLSGQPLDPRTALSWGLVDEIA
jgi:enoyl-CoA hydratase/carnithine racemase